MAEKLNDENSKVVKRSNWVLFSISLTALSSNLLWFIFSKLQLFFTEYLGLKIGIFVLVNVIYLFWTIFNDPLIGDLSDKSKKFTKKFGKRAPFVFIGHLGYSIIIILPFIVIGNIQNFPVLMAIWLCFSMCLYTTFGTLLDINYPPLFADKFRHPDQRKLSGIFILFLGVIGLILGSLVFPQLLTANLAKFSSTTAWFATIFSISLIPISISFLIIPGIKEDKKLRDLRVIIDEQQEEETFYQIFRKSMREKSFIAYMIMMLSYSIAMNIFVTSLDYWVLFVLNRPISDTSLPLMVNFLIAPIVSPIWLKISKKYGSKRVYSIGIVGFAILISLFIFVKSYILTIVIFGLAGLIIPAIVINQWSIMINVLDDMSVNFEKRQESSIQAIATLFGRLNLVITPFIFFIVQKSTGWIATSENQTRSAQFGIRLLLSLIPSLILGFGVVIFNKFFDITPEKAQANQLKLQKLGF